jgi:hypothetical protein
MCHGLCVIAVAPALEPILLRFTGPASVERPSTAEVLAARPDVEAHVRIVGMLRSVRFRGQEPGAHTRLFTRLRGR